MENQRNCDSLIDPENKTTVLATASITGTVSGPGDIYLHGRIKGDVTITGLLFIEESGSVLGKISAGNLIVAGHAKGRITVSSKIEIRSSGNIEGNIICQKIAIAEGAQLDGEVHTHKGTPLAPDYYTEKRKDLQAPAK